MISQNLQSCTDLIKVSLTVEALDDLNIKQQQLSQVLKNTLNSAKSKQANLEQAVIVWQEFKQLYNTILQIIHKSVFPDEKVSTLSGILSNIQRLIIATDDLHVIKLYKS